MSEIHRRISEMYGDREVTKRATQAVIQTQANWGVIERVEQGKRLVRLAARSLTNQQAIAWLVEAVLRHTGKAASISSPQSMAVIYPFILNQPVAYVLSNYPTLKLCADGANNQSIALREIVKGREK